MAQQRKCPLGVWLDVLSRAELAESEVADGDVDMDPPSLGGLVPWRVDPEEVTIRFH